MTMGKVVLLRRPTAASRFFLSNAIIHLGWRFGHFFRFIFFNYFPNAMFFSGQHGDPVTHACTRSISHMILLHPKWRDTVPRATQRDLIANPILYLLIPSSPTTPEIFFFNIFDLWSVDSSDVEPMGMMGQWYLLNKWMGIIHLILTVSLWNNRYYFPLPCRWTNWHRGVR